MTKEKKREDSGKIILNCVTNDNLIIQLYDEKKLINEYFFKYGPYVLNKGTDLVGVNKNINVTDFDAIKHLVIDEDIEMVVVGPEDPLVNGIYDFFKNDVLHNLLYLCYLLFLLPLEHCL